MQLMIDTNEAGAHELISTAAFLLGIAGGTEPVAARMLRAIRDVQNAATDKPIEPVNEAPQYAPNEAYAPKPPDTVTVVPPTPPATTATAVTAPATSTPTPNSAPVVAPTLDKRGFPHDSRIHSKEPKLNADGTWRARRNLDNAELEKVEGELRAQGYGAVTVNVGPGVAQVQVPLPPSAPVVAGTDAPAAPVIPQPPATAGAPPPVVPAPVSTSAFQVLMQRVSRNAQGVCSNAAIAPTWAKLGVKGWADFFQRPDLIPAMTAELDTLGAAP